MHEGDVVRLFVEKLIYGGYGFSHYETRACFVKNAIPGEIADIRIEKVKAQYLNGIVENIVLPSPHRVLPCCPIVDNCGGCQWQHIAYHHQLFWKFNIVKESFRRIAKIYSPPILSPLPCSNPFHYRTRTTLHVTGTELGYFKEGTHDIVPVENCPIIAAPLNNALNLYRKSISNEKLQRYGAHGKLNLLLINRTDDVLCFLEDNKGNQKKYLLKKGEQKIAPYRGDAVDMIDGMLFKRTAENFYQINFDQNKALIRCVLEYINPSPRDEILELYCGSGNFSLFLARTGSWVTGIELSKTAVAEAFENATLNKISTCRFVEANINNLNESFFKKKYTVILLNPPRSGCPKTVLKGIVTAYPRTVVYVSCNPATLARDIKILTAHGYNLVKIQPIDLFPQTWHIETVVLLRAKTE